MADKNPLSLTPASALDGTELLHLVKGGNSRKATLNQIGSYAGSVFAGFRATPSSTQSISNNTTTEITLGTENFDTESAFASNRFTVPSSLNGKKMCFFAGIRLTSSASTVFQILIQQSVDSGSSWISRGAMTYKNIDICCSTGPCLLNTGDIWRLAVFLSPARTVDAQPRTFFSGAVV
jgi:hypothetical protein